MSTFGRAFRVTTFGESHCPGVGCIVDGLPGKIPLTEEMVQPQLTRRRPGQSKLATARNEADEVTLLSGVEKGVSLGTPIGAMVRNKDQRPGDYQFQEDQAAKRTKTEDKFVPRPSHADYTYRVKYGIHASSGGGRSSARETIGRVIAGGIAEAYFKEKYPSIEIVAWVSRVGTLTYDMPADKMLTISRDEVDKSMTRCPDDAIAAQITDIVTGLKDQGDSVGGCVTCVVRGVPDGLGEPCFDKMEAMLAHAMLSIPATKGFEVGSGFRGAQETGSSHNDAFCHREKGPQPSHGAQKGPLSTTTNNSGGIQGGITNGQAIYFTVAFKPPATISRAQTTTDMAGTEATLEAKGRHDPCVVNRAVPIVEAMASITLMDMILLQKTRE
eukprot:TRINITY_DN37875_c0_g1_i1.p1 TRINITY_DN37875_c0_g1~~TRINITY_DN37875_c0_g1_i1.p1  ORF type:complete len:402 (+),score=90.06 TRINITY_DN37875_c0_g1_i1:53-1207(+)